MTRPSLQPDTYPIGASRMAMDSRMRARDEDDDRDPIEVLRAYLDSKLAAPDMARVHRLLDAMSDKAAGGRESGAMDSDIRRRVRAGAAKMAEDASVAAADVHARFPGMSRIRIG
jgi:hypothetical protein